MKKTRLLATLTTLFFWGLLLLPARFALAWDNIPYLDSNGRQVYANNVTVLSSDPDKHWALQGGWYLVQGNMSAKSISIHGTVNLILANGCSFTSNEIMVPKGTAIRIYGQSADEDTMGSLTATATGSGVAGIGGLTSLGAGTVTINGGRVTARGGSDGAGIGGSMYVTEGTVLINGGIVDATGGEDAPGIGWGSYDGTGTVTINGGTINAQGGDAAAGIGGGFLSGAGSVRIAGGTVVAIGGLSAAGIGSGGGAGPVTIEISGGVCEARGKGAPEDYLGAGAGIGGGAGSAATIKISGGRVSAWGSTDRYGGAAAGIGGGSRTDGDVSIEISGGTVLSETEGKAQGIGSASAYSGATTIRFTGGTVEADRVGAQRGDALISLSWTDVSDAYKARAWNGGVTLDAARPFCYKYQQRLVTTPIEGRSTIVPAIHMLLFDGAGASGQMQTRASNEPFSTVLPASDFTPPAGKALDGWEIDGTRYGVGDRFEVLGNKVAKAIWREAIVVDGISIVCNQDLSTIVVGGHLNVTAHFTPEDADDKRVLWASSDESVARVGSTTSDTTGCRLELLSEGTFTLSATALGPKNVSTDLKITVLSAPVARINVVLPHDVMIVGDVAQATAEVLPEYAGNRAVRWTSTNAAVAEVDPKTGEIRALAPGRADIVATALDGSGVTGQKSLDVLSDQTGAVPYIDEHGEQQFCTSAKSIIPTLTEWDGGWYVAEGTFTVSERAYARGDVRLILADGAKVTFERGFGVNTGARLSIYAQSTGDEKGQLIARADSRNAAIGGDAYVSNPGAITICGGAIEATGTPYSASIGGGYGGGCDVKIYDGTIYARNIFGTAIGGGTNGMYAVITIHGGVVQAEVGDHAAAIGASSISGAFVTYTIVRITGGTVRAKAGYTGVGIGYCTISLPAEQTAYVGITIEGGDIEASAMDQIYSANGNGYGIGNNSDTTQDHTSIILEWTDRENDRISCSRYSTDVTLMRSFVYEGSDRAVASNVDEGQTIVPFAETYTYVWLDGDGTELERATFFEGDAEPQCSKQATRAPTDEATYVFDAWDAGTIVGATTTFTPTFKTHYKDKTALGVTGDDRARRYDLYTVSGRLTDEAGAGIKGAPLTISFDGVAYTTTTSDAEETAGAYELAVTPQRAGTVEVTVDYAGTDERTSARATMTREVKDATRSHITLDRVHPIAPDGSPTISGVLQSEDGTPIAHATIRTSPAVGEGGARFVFADATTDADGRFTCTGAFLSNYRFALGEQEVDVTFEGDDTYTRSAARAMFAVIEPPSIRTTTIPDAEVGVAYAITLASDGEQPILWSLASGTLPEGVTLASDGTLAGTPTERGTFTIYVRATNEAGTSERELALHVAAPSHVVTLDCSAGGTCTLSASEAREGDTVTVYPLASESYTLSSVTATDSAGAVTVTQGEDGWTFTQGSSPVTVHVRFERLFNLQISHRGAGSYDVSQYQGTTGTEIRLTATPDPGNHFVGWTVTWGDATIEGDILTIGTTDVLVMVEFEQDKPVVAGPYLVSYDVGGIGTAPAPVESGAGPHTALPQDRLGPAVWAQPTNDDDHYARDDRSASGWYRDKALSQEADYYDQIFGDTTLYYRWVGPAPLIESVELEVTPVAGDPIPPDPFLSSGPVALGNTYVSVSGLADYELDFVYWHNPDQDATFVAGKTYEVDIFVRSKGASAIVPHFKGHASAYTTGGLDQDKAYALTIGGIARQDCIMSVNATDSTVTYAYTVPKPKATVTLVSDPATGGVVTGGGAFEVGSSATVSARPREGHTFMGWYQKGTLVSTEAAYTLTVTTDVTLTARFEEVKTYDVDLAVEPAGAGTVTGAGTYDEGQEATVEATAGKGYTFLRWEEAGKAVSAKASHSFKVTTNRTLVAVFEAEPPVNHTVSVHATSGGTATGGGTFADGETCTLGAHAHGGHRFVGWYEGNKLVTNEATHTFTVTADVTLEARFEEEPTPTFDVDLTVEPAGAGTVAGVGTYDEGQTATVTATASEGHRFLRWEENGRPVSTEATYSFKVTTNRTIVAVFEAEPPVTHTVSVHATPGGTATGGGTFADGETCSVYAHAHNDHRFVGWFEGAKLVSDDATHTFAVTADIELEARFEAEPLPTFDVDLAVEPTGAGTVTGAGAYDEGERATVTATASEDYDFLRWEEKGASVSTEAAYSFKATTNRSLVAVFEAKTPKPVAPATHTVTVGALAGGSATGGGSFVEGEACTVYAHAHEGYDFTGWYEGERLVSTDAAYTLTVTTDVTLTARFEEVKTYGVDLAVEPAGAGTVTGAGTYDEGQAATVVATAGKGYTFLRWEEAGKAVSTEATYPFKVTGDRTLVAVFEAEPSATHMVSVRATPGGTATGGGTFTKGETCTLGAHAHNDHRFVGWFEGTKLVSDEATHTFTVTADIELEARFEAEPLPTFDVYLAVEPAGAGTVAGAGTYDEGERATVTATASEDYDFLRWEENGASVSSDAAYSFEATGDRSLVAVFEAKTPKPVAPATHTVSVGALAGGSATGGGSFVEGEVCTVYAHAHGGYDFTGWYEGERLVSADATYTFPVTQDTALTARFEEVKTYGVDLAVEPAGAGTVTGAGTYDEGQAATVVATAGKGYTFLRWEEAGKAVSTKATHSFKVTTNRTLVAVFEAEPPATHTVSVHATSGGTATGGGTFTKGERCTLGAHAHDGFRLIGWYEDNRLVSEDATYSFSVTADVTLEARFEELVSFDVDLAVKPVGAGTVTGAGTYDEGQEVTVTAAAGAGHRFLYWEENGASVSTDAAYSFKVATNRSLVAVFEAEPPVTHRVFVHATTGGSATGGGTFTIGDECTVYAHTHEGHRFVGWYVGDALVSDDLAYSFVVVKDVTLEARFRALDTHGYVWLDGDGTVLERATWLEGEDEPTCSKVPAKTSDDLFSYTFSSWDAGTVAGSVTTFRPIFTATELPPIPTVATFDVTVSLTPPQAGTVTGAGTYDEGEQIRLVAQPHPGWHFLRWTENGSVIGTDATLAFVVHDNRSVVAEFEQDEVEQHRVDVVGMPVGAGVVSGGGTYDVGETATVIAHANEGYEFDCWMAETNVVSTDATYSFEVTSDVVLIASFKALPDGKPEPVPQEKIEVALDANQGAGTVSGGGTYNLGEMVTVTAHAHEGYVFACWREGTDEVSTDASYTFEATRDRTLVAVFEELVPESHTVLVHATEGGTATGGGTFDAGATCTVLAHAHTDYRFVGWYVEDTLVSTDAAYAFVVTKDVTLEARFEELPAYVSVWLDANDEEIDRIVWREGETEPVCAKVPAGKSDDEYTYVFESWDEGTREGRCTYYRPRFTKEAKPRVTLVAEPEEGGSTTGAGRYAPGSEVRVEATAAEGFAFSGWYEGDELVGTVSSHTLVTEGDITLTARFERSVLATILWLDADGDVLESARWHAGDEEPTCSVTPTKAEDSDFTYTFRRWDEGTRTNDVIIYHPLFFAELKPQVTLTCEPVGAGTTTGAGRYQKGTRVEVTATAAEGFAFSGWYAGDKLVERAPAYALEIDQDVILTARFERVPQVTVVWLDAKGEVLESVPWYAGEDEPVCSQVPTKESDDTYDYAFTGWDEGTRTGDTLTYRPQFKATKRGGGDGQEVTYTIVSGKDATWHKGAASGHTVTVKRSFADDETFGRFRQASVDGIVLADTHLDKQAGSLVLTLKPSYLQTLATGTHQLLVTFDDGEVGSSLTITDATPGPDSNPDSDPDPDKDPSQGKDESRRTDPYVPSLIGRLMPLPPRSLTGAWPPVSNVAPRTDATVRSVATTSSPATVPQPSVTSPGPDSPSQAPSSGTGTVPQATTGSPSVVQVTPSPTVTSSLGTPATSDAKVPAAKMPSTSDETISWYVFVLLAALFFLAARLVRWTGTD